MNLTRRIFLPLAIIILLICSIIKTEEIEAKQGISYSASLKISQTPMKQHSKRLTHLSLPEAGEAKAERPRIRRIGLSPSQYANSPGRLCQTDVNVALAKDPIIYSSNPNLKYSKKIAKEREKKEKHSTDVLDKADTENVIVKQNDDSCSHITSLPQQHNNSLLYSLVQAEAGNQDLDGCRLVADVVLNRIDSDRFPNTLEEVIYAPGQFSVVRNGALKKSQGKISEKVIQAVDMELSQGRLNTDVLYFNNSNNGGWKYGEHYFK